MKKLLITTLFVVALVSPKAFAQKTTTTTTAPATTTDVPAATEEVEHHSVSTDVQTETTEEKDPGGLFLEPSLVYETGKGAIDFQSVAQPDGDVKGTGFGLRFGGHINDVFFLAADGSYSEPEFSDDSGANFSYDLKSWLAGITLGVQTPVVGLRAWGSYLPFGEIELDGRGSNDSNITYKDPRLWKIGLGFRVAVISLNLEYLTGDYTKMEVRNAGSMLSGTYNGDASRDSWLASISFPLAL